MATDAQQTDNRHSPDFAWCCWNGTVYTFSPRQAKFVSLLWQAWEGGHELSDRWMLEQTNAHCPKVRDAFRNHPAWGEMIQLGSRRGFKRLG